MLYGKNRSRLYQHVQQLESEDLHDNAHKATLLAGAAH